MICATPCALHWEGVVYYHQKEQKSRVGEMGMVVVNREKKNEFFFFCIFSRLPSSSSFSSFTLPTHTQVFSSLMAEEWPTSPSSHSPSSTSSLSAVFIGQHHQLATAVEVLLLLQLSTAQFSFSLPWLNNYLPLFAQFAAAVAKLQLFFFPIFCHFLPLYLSATHY